MRSDSALASATLPTSSVSGRKLRILALHGGYSNSTLLKFQLAGLRRQFGKDVEWLFVDATIPLHPYAKFKDLDPFPELPARLTEGKGVHSWYTLDYDKAGRITSDADEWNSSLSQLLEFVKKEAPIDLIIGFSQGALMIAFMAHRLRQQGERIPWQVAFLFSPSDPTYDYKEPFEDPLPFSVFFIVSPTDPHYERALGTHGHGYSEVVVLEHDDGYAFPMAQPRAGEIYALLVEEVRRRFSLASEGQPCGSEARPAPGAAGAGEEYSSHRDSLHGARKPLALLQWRAR